MIELSNYRRERLFYSWYGFCVLLLVLMSCFAFVFRFLSSAFCLLLFVFCFLSSAFCLLLFVFCFLSSAFVSNNGSSTRMLVSIWMILGCGMLILNGMGYKA
jgi:uncharacterized membrane protein YjjP (DUF1212 family)